MPQLAVILDNLVKIPDNVDGGSNQQPPSGKQQQIFQQQHRDLSSKSNLHSPQRTLRTLRNEASIACQPLLLASVPPRLCDSRKAVPVFLRSSRVHLSPALRLNLSFNFVALFQVLCGGYCYCSVDSTVVTVAEAICTSPPLCVLDASVAGATLVSANTFATVSSRSRWTVTASPTCISV